SKRTESQSRWQKQLRVGTQGRGTRYKERWMPTRRCRKSAVIGRSAPSGGKKPLRTRARILGLGPRTFNGELFLLQIRDQVPDAICEGDVDENDFGSIRCRRRELDAAAPDKSGEAILGYIDASRSEERGVG